MPGSLPSQRSIEVAPFEALYRATVRDVRVYVTAMVGANLADDVLADSYEVVLRRWADIPEPLDERRMWVFGVARRTALASQRRVAEARRRSGEHVLDPAAPDVADLVAADDRLARLLGALPPKEREAMTLTTTLDLTVAEAARVAGCTEAALSMRLTRARRRVADRLATEAGAETEADDVR